MSEALLGVLIGGAIGLAGSLLSNRAARKRQTEQLTHERTMQEREELRGLIDEAMQAVQDAMYRAAEMRDAWTREGPQVYHLDLDDPMSYRERFEELNRLRQRLNGYQSRLAVRLGVGNELTESVTQIRVKLGVLQMLAPHETNTPTETDMQELRRTFDEASNLVEDFEKRSLKYAGSKLTPEG